MEERGVNLSFLPMLTLLHVCGWKEGVGSKEDWRRKEGITSPSSQCQLSFTNPLLSFMFVGGRRVWGGRRVGGGRRS